MYNVDNIWYFCTILLMKVCTMCTFDYYLVMSHYHYCKENTAANNLIERFYASTTKCWWGGIMFSGCPSIRQQAICHIENLNETWHKGTSPWKDQADTLLSECQGWKIICHVPLAQVTWTCAAKCTIANWEENIEEQQYKYLPSLTEG